MSSQRLGLWVSVMCLLHGFGDEMRAQPYSLGENREGLNRRVPALINQYLSTLDSADVKVRRLIDQSRDDLGAGKPADALQKLQVALVLEGFPEVQEQSRFDLFHTLGDHTYRFHPTYADLFYKKAAAIALRGQVDPDRIFVLMTNRAGLLSRIEQLDSAAWYYHEAIRVAPRVSVVAHASAYNNLGVFYESIGRLDSAEILYARALHVLGSPQLENILYCSIMDNLASVARHEGRYAFMDSIYQYNDSVYYTLKLYNRYFVNGVRWLKLKMLKGDPGSRDRIMYLDTILTRYMGVIRPEEKLKFYEAAADFYSVKGDKVGYQRYMDRGRNLRDEMERKAMDQTFALASGLMDVQAIHYQRELEYLLELNRQRQTKLRLAIILFVSLALAAGAVILILGLFIRNRKQKHEAQRKADEAEIRARAMEARLIEQELKHREQDLTQVVLHNTHVHDNQQQVLVRLMKLQTERPENVLTGIRHLVHDLEAQKRMGADLLSLQSKLETVNAAFYSRLLTHFPSLTSSEQELCGYLRIQLSTKDISLLRNIEAASVKMSKNRLRKKLGLEPEADLYQFIQTI